MDRSPRYFPFLTLIVRFHLALLIGAALVGPSFVIAQPGGTVEMSALSGDPAAPRRHFRLKHQQKLTPQRAGEIYAIVRPALQLGYSRATSSVAANYQNWRRMNTTPYLSATHGNHYLNSYVNEIGAASYLRFEAAGKMPIGAIIAKDSFSMTTAGEILLGGLFLMEKMPGGFSDLADDWKYTFIQADGTLFGETNASGSKRVEYCISCHLAAPHPSHLWFMPKAFRVPAGD
jgi:hypothetical protein